MDIKEFDFDKNLEFIDGQLKRLRETIEKSSSLSVKDLADYHRFAESMMFIAKAKKEIERQ